MPENDVPCDLCGSSDRVILFDRARNSESVINTVCERCGLVYVSPRPDSEDIAAHYATGAFSVDARGGEKPSVEKINRVERLAMQRYQRLTSRFPKVIQEQGAILEIGCGIGSFLRLMRGLGWQIDGLEPDLGYAESGREQYGIQIESKVYEAVEERRLTYDLIASFHVLEHVTSPSRFLKKAFAELKTGGLLYLEVPTIDKPYEGNLELFFWSAHLYSFSSLTLQAMLRMAGFSVEYVGYFGQNLEVFARKRLEPTEPVDFPVEEAAQVVRKTRSAYERYRLLSKFPRVPNVPRVLSKLSEIYREDKSEIPALIARESRKKFLPMERNGFYAEAKSRVAGKFVTHYGMHVVANAGDVMLFDSVRKVFSERLGIRRWSREALWDEVRKTDVERINRSGRGVVIGGGGLLLKDTNPNANSGWQWNCTTERLNEFRVPIAVFAIGYNRFRSQPDFDDVFKENVNLLVNKSAFFGLRNKGSIAALEEYLEPNNNGKLMYQPCPTTILNRIYKVQKPAFKLAASKILGLNIAFDRQSLRFEGDEDRILDAIAQAMSRACAEGWKIKLMVHVRSDLNVMPWLQKHRVPFDVVRLDGKMPRQILNAYSNVDLTIGMRGHSQMVPFGLGNAIISLVSHDKLRYFLDDIGHPEWGIEINDPGLLENLIAAIKQIGDERLAVSKALEESQDRLWDVTCTNLDRIREAGF